MYSFPEKGKHSGTSTNGHLWITATLLINGGGRVVRWCWVNFQCRGVLLIWIRVGQGPTELPVYAGGGCLDIFPVYTYILRNYFPVFQQTSDMLKRSKLDQVILHRQVEAIRLQIFLDDPRTSTWVKKYFVGIMWYCNVQYFERRNEIQLTLVISTSFISNNRLSRRENLVVLLLT